MKKTIGIIGFGNMGSAIAGQIKTKVYVFDTDKLKTKDIKDRITVAPNVALLVQNSDIVILAVKPQDFALLLDSISRMAVGGDKLFISIAAGITTGYIEKVLGKVRVIRGMPNRAALIGESLTALSKGAYAKDDDLRITEELFSSIGKTFVVSEKMMDAVTAISGSGPGYICDYIERERIDPKNFPEEKKQEFLSNLKKAANSLGFDADLSDFLARNTLAGTIALLDKTGISAGDLKRQVSSKGGTTEAALEVLHRGGSLVDAAGAAVTRARELSRG